MANKLKSIPYVILRTDGIVTTGRTGDKHLSAIEGDWTDQRLCGFAETVYIKSEHVVSCRGEKGELLLQWSRSK